MYIPKGRESSKLKTIFFLDETFPLSAPNFEETPIVVTKQGGTAEAAIDGVNETIDSIANTA